MSPITDTSEVPSVSGLGSDLDPLSPGPGSTVASPLSAGLGPRAESEVVEASPTSGDLTDDRRREKREKRAKGDKKEKKSKGDKKSKKDKSSKKKRGGDSSSDDDDFMLDDQDQLLGQLKKEGSASPASLAGQPSSPGVNRQESAMTTALRRMASKIQQQSTVVSVLHGQQQGAGPQQGALIKVLNRAAGFMFLSTSVGRSHQENALGVSYTSKGGDDVTSDDGMSQGGDVSDTLAPFAAFMSGAAIPPADDPDTQRFLVQSLTIPGHSGSYIAFAAKSPIQPTVFLGAAAPAVTNPFQPQPAGSASRPGSGQANRTPEVHFSAPFDPERHCWKVIPSEGSWFFLQPAAHPGFVIECPPPTAMGKSGVGKPLLLRLAHFSGAPTQCFRSSTSRGVGSSMDSGSVGRVEEVDETSSSGISGTFGLGAGLAGTRRPMSGGVLSVGSGDGELGTVMSAAEQLDHMLWDDSAMRLQAWARGCLTRKAIAHVRRTLDTVATKRAKAEALKLMAADALVAAALSFASSLESLRRMKARTNAAATRINSAARVKLARNAVKSREWILQRAEADRMKREAEWIAAADRRAVIRIQALGRAVIAAKRPLANRRKYAITITAFARALRSTLVLSGQGVRSSAARRVQSAWRQCLARATLHRGAMKLRVAEEARVAREASEWEAAAAAEEAIVAALAPWVHWQLALRAHERQSTARRLVTATMESQRQLQHRASCLIAAQRRTAVAHSSARVLQLRALPSVRARRTVHDLQERHRLCEDARVWEEAAADAFTVKDAAVRVLQRKLCPIALARTRRVEAARRRDDAVSARVFRERRDDAAREIQRVVRAGATRRWLRAQVASEDEARNLLQRTFAGFVVRVAVAIANPAAPVLRRYEAFPSAAGAASSPQHHVPDSPGRRYRRAAFNLTHAVDNEGFVRLRELRPSSAARRPPRKPSDWSLEASVLRRAEACRRESVLPAGEGSPPHPHDGTQGDIANRSLDGQGVAATLARTPHAQTPAKPFSRPPSATYPFRVPSALPPDSSHRPLHARTRRPTSVLLRPATSDSAEPNASAAATLPSPSRGGSRYSQAQPVAPGDVAALRFLRGDNATPTAATRDMAAEMCAALLRGNRASAADRAAAQSAIDTRGTVATPNESALDLPPTASSGGVGAADGNRMDGIPLDAVAHLLVDSPLPTPGGSRRSTVVGAQAAAQPASDSALDAPDGGSGSPHALPALSGSPLPTSYAGMAPQPPPPTAAPLNRPPSGRRKKPPTGRAAGAADGGSAVSSHAANRRITAKLTPYHLLKFRSLRAVGPWTGAVDTPATGAFPPTPHTGATSVGGGSPRVQGARPPRPPSGGRTKPRPTAVAAKDSPGRTSSPMERSMSPVDSGGLPPPAAAGRDDPFECSTESEAAVARAPQSSARPVPLAAITPMRAALERRLATHDLYTGHLEYLKRLLAEHGALVASSNRMMAAL